MRAPLRRLAAAQHGAFSTAQALTCYSRSEVRARLRSGRWRSLSTAVHRHSSSEVTARMRLAGAGLAIGRPVPGVLATAAALHGFDVLGDAVTHVAVEPGLAALRRPALWPHQFRLDPRDLVRLPCGLLVTTADRTAVDLARLLPRLDVLPVLDAALGAGWCTVGSLLAEVPRHAGLPGVRQARELVPLATAGPESPPESRLRQLCHDAGLPAPTVQLPVPGRDGRAVRWLDLGWEEAQVGLEYDGQESHDPRRRLRADRRRHDGLSDRGWAMFYATDADVHGDPAVLLAQVDRALRRRSRARGRGP